MRRKRFDESDEDYCNEMERLGNIALIVWVGFCVAVFLGFAIFT